MMASHLGRIVRSLARDDNGAALIEYTTLIGFLVLAVIAMIIAVGTWVRVRWTTLLGFCH
jgi:pilus assembly protein Flp/PilA